MECNDLEKIKEHKKSIYIVVFLLYLLFIIWLCLLLRQPDERKVSMLGETFIAVWKYPWTWILLVMTFANVLLYIPVGVLLERITQSNGISIFSGGMLSIIVEVTQFLTCRGTLDFDDIVNNTVGAILGVFLIDILKCFKRKTGQMPIGIKIVLTLCGIYGVIIVRHLSLHLFWNLWR